MSPPGTITASEMDEQPRVLNALIERWDELCDRVRAEAPEELEGIVLVARGSSDHAALYGRYLLELATGRPVALAAPSLALLYGARTDYRGWLAVAVSQSGRTPEISSVIRRLREDGAQALALTNDPESPLGEAVNLVLELGAGEERAVPATKTVTSEFAVFALIAEALGTVPWSRDDLARVPAAVARTLADRAPVDSVTARLAGARGIFSLARGLLYAVAQETALKLKETALVLAEGYSAADFRHGPIAVAGPGTAALCLVARGPAHADMADLAADLQRRGADVVRVGEDDGADLPLPGGLPEALGAFPALVRGQQLGHGLALRLGLDPDAPRGLSKVTAT
jgi:glucosamine--fructose-6-phosphate aminotransferase (isomerizing)